MYIEPNTHLEFFQDLHIDPDYENTIYFPTTQAKDNYFANLPSIKTPKCYYQRQNRGYCRVEIPYAQMLDRSYMRFKNNSFEDKWFYAFVLDIEYINNITTEVHYQLDVMMTWCGGGYVLDECFVEREHTETDAIGDNVVPESFDTSFTVHNSIGRTGYMDEWNCLIVFAPDSTRTSSGSKYGYYTVLSYQFASTVSGTGGLIDYINSLSGAEQERIQGIYYVPRAFIPEVMYRGQLNGSAPVHYPIAVPKPVKGVTSIDGYSDIKNAKLFTYPYYFLRVESSEGERQDLAFELSRAQAGITFELRGIVGEMTQIALIPEGYNTPTINDENYNEQMTLREFPMIGWTVDTYKAFLAQQMVSIPANLLTAGTQALMGNTVGAVASATSSTIGLIDGAIKTTLKPFASKGQDTPQLSLALDNEYKDFWFYEESIRGYQAKIIDEYFTMFGYAVNEVKTPNVNARPYYTYVKTIGCHVHGSLPEADKREIENVFNKGVRFWKESHQYIGKYNGDGAPDNSPV